VDLTEVTSKINVDIAGKHIRIMRYSSLVVANAYDDLRRDGHDFGNYRYRHLIFHLRCVNRVVYSSMVQSVQASCGERGKAHVIVRARISVLLMHRHVTATLRSACESCRAPR